MTAAIRAGQRSACAARTTASMLLPRPEIRMTMFFIGRHCTLFRQSGLQLNKICCNAAGRTGAQNTRSRAGAGDGSGLLEGVKYPERDFFVGPVIGSVAEDIQQGFPCF